ncbi:MAG TPA: hypothetical protein VM936_10695 [Pyrinomonadaceae bacterium]|nr:hypothetical protein [Pyrinomonadaceae bacterium]
MALFQTHETTRRREKMADETVRDDAAAGAANQCKNAPCTCPVEKGEKFCSVHCQSTGNTIQIDCDCGHETCKGDF